MATVSRESGGAEDFCSPPLPRPNALSLTIQEHMIKKLLSIEEEDMIDDDLFTYTETVFASVCAWNSSLTLAGLHKHTHGLDYRLAEDCVAQIGRIARETIQEVASSYWHSKRGQESSFASPSQDALRCYVLPLYKDFTDPKQTAKLQTPYAEGVLKLDKEMAEVFKRPACPRVFPAAVVPGPRSELPSRLPSGAVELRRLLHPRNCREN
ncbi:uncharacterized protein LOC135097896 isoform X1 [Scylla paramamosain]|uniref:uncharacterized protein LOC135097896 isoform X1 n=1 Tax=Scylla paramamosain TaxID=85552 RepID=UPI003083778A